MSKGKVVLAYSGGLDTSVILKWLLEQRYEVFAYMANIGQEEDFKAAEQKALRIGASKVFIEDMKKEFVTDYIFPVYKANTLYEGRYLLGTAIARPIIAKKQIEIAKQVGADYVSHGATGKGNDQVRFELSYYALNPKIKVIAPWKNADFLSAFKGSSLPPNPIVKTTTCCIFPMKPVFLKIPVMSVRTVFIPIPYPRKMRRTPPQKLKLNSKTVFRSRSPTLKIIPLFEYLNKLGRENGIGRLDMVENRFVGIKSRGVYETPGGTILHEAHKDIEGIAMDREVMRLRDMLSGKFAELIYNGFWFSPEMEFIMAAIDKSQEVIDGEVTLKLYKGTAYPVARTSRISRCPDKPFFPL